MQTKTYRFILILFISLIVIGCVHNSNCVIRKLQGKTIDLTWEMNYIGKTQNLDKIADVPYKIVTMIDSSYCTPCLVNYLKTAESYMERLSDSSIGFICIIHPKSLIELEEEISELDLSELVLIDDSEDRYTKINGLTKYNCVMRSFLLDDTNTIVLVGDPLRNKKVKYIYDDYFTKMHLK